MATTIDGNQKLNIYSSFTLSNDDVASVSLLYAPLIGSDALMLYLGFSSLLERNNLKNEKLTHQDIYDIYSMKKNQFLSARYKLEAIGLLMTYETKDNGFIYVLCPPLTPKSFLRDNTLGLYLYSKITKETFNYIKSHFEIEKIDKYECVNVTKSFDEVYKSVLDNEATYEKFKYILGKKPNKNLVIKNNPFNFEAFAKEINKDCLEMGITKNFQDQISMLAFVYGFDEAQMVGLYHDSINKRGLYDYRLLKNNANKLFVYQKNMNGPKLEVKDDEIVENTELVDYLDNASPSVILEENYPNFPEKYLDTVSEIYANINLPRGVLNCMILKIMKDKGGVLPNLQYFKKASESWIRDKVFTTNDAIKYITTMDVKGEKKDLANVEVNGGFEML